ncbi:radical SAM protein [Phycicoccus jejuensis]|uniref:radical SAM protein n=1 Tax=Phycicoccus jejuensis TaxID=367299 RepID=UPI00384C8489
MKAEWSDYGARAAFVFVPNLCNAACSFCYVAPKFTESAHLSPVVMRRAGNFAETLEEMGCEEVRFTGGEPLLFANFAALVSIFISRGFKYRILTNGLCVEPHLDYLTAAPPEQVTISVHDTHIPSIAFGVQVDNGTLSKNRRALAQITTVEATIVMSPNRPSTFTVRSLRKTLRELKADGVRRIKLIFENTFGSAGALQQYESLAQEIATEWGPHFDDIRRTDAHEHKCKLRSKGFLSLDLGRGTATACCVQMGDATVPTAFTMQMEATQKDAQRLSGMTLRAAKEAARGQRLPCTSHYGGCPLALK